VALTTSGALKAFLEAQGLGISVYQDKVPAETKGFADPANTNPVPYLIVLEDFPVVPDAMEDNQIATIRETVQIDVWMPLRNLQTGVRLESTTLPYDVARVLAGSRLLVGGAPTHPKTVYGVLIGMIGPRLVVPDDNTVKIPITVDIRRVL
jgi:hypothetical protein